MRSAKIINMLNKIDFNLLNSKFFDLAKLLKQKRNQFIEVLTDYETYEVADDEIRRSLDLLLNISENKFYFQYKIRSVLSFLPLNQPLYSLICFVFVPSFQSTKLAVKVPNCSDYLFRELLPLLKPHKFFSNVDFFYGRRENFLKKFAHKTKVSQIDAIIFTGKSENASTIRKMFPKKTLVITNGSGHNPVIISEHGLTDKAIEGVLKVQLYNQGQDCAGPNSILISNKVYDEFTTKLLKKIKKVGVGSFKKRNNRVGPISHKGKLLKIVNFLEKNIKYISDKTEGVIKFRDKLIYPMIIEKPLLHGGNYQEQFAPVFVLQKYENDQDLKYYFENDLYRKNAMYVTVYGSSRYINTMVKMFNKKEFLHNEASIIRNKNLHTFGIERGIRPYGGYGLAASSISFNGNLIAKPTLPQRDIFENLVMPKLEEDFIRSISHCYSIYPKYQTNPVLINKKINFKNFVDICILCNWDQRKILKFFSIYEAKLNKQRFSLLFNCKHKWIKEYYKKYNIKHLLSKNILYLSKMEKDSINYVRYIYQFIKKRGLKYDEIKELFNKVSKKNINFQRKVCKDLYNLLIGADSGPQISTLIWFMDKHLVLELLNI